MSEFAFLFRGGERPPTQNPQDVMQQWVRWIENLRKRDVLKDPGRPLERTGTLVKGNPKIVTDSLDIGVETIGGYLIVEAKDLRQAVELTSGCPTLEVGGFVEVRPIMRTS